jgi:hypothetical protein
MEKARVIVVYALFVHKKNNNTIALAVWRLQNGDLVAKVVVLCRCLEARKRSPNEAKVAVISTL